MKYLLVAHYAGVDLDDPEELVNSCWNAGFADTESEAVEIVKEEFNKYIAEQVEYRFDLDDEEVDTEEIEDFKSKYEISIFSQTDKWPENIVNLEIGELYLDGEFYFEDLKINIIKLED